MKHYLALGFSESDIKDPSNISEAAIKKAYYQKALTCHPDKTSDKEAHNLFVKIQEAYSILSDPEKRALYDQFGDSSDNLATHLADQPVVSVDEILAYQEKYQNSQEEANDLIGLFIKFNGDLNQILDCLLFSNAQPENINRYERIIQDAILVSDKSSKSMKRSQKNIIITQDILEACRKNYPWPEKVIKSRRRRELKDAKEFDSQQQGSKENSSDPMSSLALAIKSKQGNSSKFDEMIAGLEEKYIKKKVKRSK